MKKSLAAILALLLLTACSSDRASDALPYDPEAVINLCFGNHAENKAGA